MRKDDGLRTLIKSGRVVTGTDDYVADILIEGESIVLIGASLTVDVDRIIDASNRYVFPGGVDPHTHMQLPFAGTETIDTFTTGTIAAAKGGTTTIIDFPVQQHGERLTQALDNWLAKLEDNPPVVDVGFHMIVRDLSGELGKDISVLVNEGVSSFKLFMAYKDVLMVDDETIFEALLNAGEVGALTMMHAENGGVIESLVRKALAEGKTAPRYHMETRPALAEAEATHRALAIANMANAPIYIVHLSCEEALRHVQDAHSRGQQAYAETCPQYLFLDESVYDDLDFEPAKYVFTPPARTKRHQEALWRGLAFDDLTVISTDHCPFCYKGQKELGREDFTKIPNGGPGVEHRLQLVHDGGVRAGRISLNRMVELLSTTPAKLFGLFPRKGTIAVGSDADVVVFDPARKETLSVDSQFSKVDYCAYEGREVTGAPDIVLCRGRVVYENGKSVAEPGYGRFIRRAQHLTRLDGEVVPEALRVSW